MGATAMARCRRSASPAARKVELLHARSKGRGSVGPAMAPGVRGPHHQLGCPVSPPGRPGADAIHLLRVRDRLWVVESSGRRPFRLYRAALQPDLPVGAVEPRTCATHSGGAATGVDTGPPGNTLVGPEPPVSVHLRYADAEQGQSPLHTCRSARLRPARGN
jgi:hypothetical protein